MEIGIKKIIVLVIDSLGVGEQPDASFFHKRGANTLKHVAEAANKLTIPNLARLGLGNLTYTRGVPRERDATGFFGKMRSRSIDKDSVSGHWELCGLVMPNAFNNFFEAVPDSFLNELMERTEKEFLVLNDEQVKTNFDAYAVEHKVSEKPILICSQESKVMVTGQKDILSEIDMYMMGEIMRELGDTQLIATVGSYFFEGSPGDYRFLMDTKREFIIPPPSPTLLDSLYDRSIPVIGVGKISDIFATAGLTDMHKPDTTSETIEAVRKLILDSAQSESGQVMILANFHEFDSIYGHNCDPVGYAKELENFDTLLPRILRAMASEDILFIVADHGLDPTFPDGNHTREYVPIIAYSRLFKPQGKGDLGVRSTFSDLAETISEAYDLNTHYAASSFWGDMVAHL